MSEPTGYGGFAHRSSLVGVTCHGIRCGSCDNDRVTRSKTTSIPRPKEPAKASDDGRSRLGDFTRPIPVEKRLFRRPKLALFSGIFVLLVIGTIAAAVFILPMGTWFDQGDQLVQRQAELDELQRVNGQLAGEVERLDTEAGIREAAREEIGFVEEGDQRSTILPLPPVPSDLPDGWPYNVVTQIFAARTAGPAPAVAD
jgi:cell division protein FtsB